MAESAFSLELWVKDIQQAIIAANKEVQMKYPPMSSSTHSMHSANKAGALRVLESVDQWLDALSLPEHKAAFEAQDYKY